MKLTLSVLVLSIFSQSLAFANCEDLLKNQINELDAKIKGRSLLVHLGIGAGVGAVGGVGRSLHQQHDRNSYLDGHNAGASPAGYDSGYNAGYQAGHYGQTGADYLDGYQTAQYGSSEVPGKPNYVANAAIGAGIGAAVGAGGFYIKKIFMERKLEKLKVLKAAFSPLANDAALTHAAKLISPSAQKENLAGLRQALDQYNDQYCLFPEHVVTVKSVKKYLKRELK